MIVHGGVKNSLSSVVVKYKVPALLLLKKELATISKEMKFSYLAAVAILYAFGYAEADCYGSNQAGILYIVPEIQGNGGAYYKIEGVVHGMQPSTYIAYFPVKRCHDAETAANNAAARNAAAIFQKTYYFVPNGHYHRFQQAIATAIARFRYQSNNKD